MKINISHILQIIFFAIFTFGCTDSTIDADSVLSLVDRTISNGGTEDPNKTPDVSYSLNVDVTNIVIDSSDEWSGTFTISSNDNWTVSSPASWVTLLPESGNGNATISVKVDEYLTNESNAVDRIAIIVVKGEHSGTKEISLSQKSPAKDNKNTYATLVDGITFINTIQKLAHGGVLIEGWHNSSIDEIRVYCNSKEQSSILVSSENSEYPIYANFSNGIITLNTSATSIECNKNSSYMFYGLLSVNSLDLSSFDTHNVTDMSYMFYDCFNLTSLNLSGFNTDNVTDMECMFSGCRSLTSLDLSSFNTQNVTVMRNMFYECSNLTSLDLSKFKTENVKKMGLMFYECSNLTSLDLSSFNTQNVTDINGMFLYCFNLTTLDLSSFNTKNVTIMSHMFDSCRSLTTLDISNFDTRNVTNMASMFGGCINMSTLNLGKNFVVNNNTDKLYMCTSLASTSKSCNISCITSTKTALSSVYTGLNSDYISWNILD